MSAADEILSQIPIGQLAAQLGIDEAEAEQAVRQAVPALLGGMQANAQDAGGEASLQAALGQHLGNPLEGGLGAIDIDDGDKIVRHVFGDNRDEVINRLGSKTGGGGLMGKLLPLLAPLVMSWLAGKFSGGGQDRSAPAGGGGGLGDIGDLLGGLTGGGGSGEDSGGGGGGIGDLLGGLAGGGGSGGGIGDLLGGLLGGGSDADDGGGSGGIGDLLGGLLGGGRKS